MTFRPNTITPADRQMISSQWHLLFTDDAWPLGFIGPQLNVAKSDPILRKYVGNVRTSEESDANAVAFGSLGTFFIPSGEKKGIWGMNATSKFDVDQAIASGSHLPSGWLMKITDQLPTNAEMQTLFARPGWFGPGGKRMWDEIYNRAELEAANMPKVVLKPKELTVYGYTIFVANTSAESSENIPENPHAGVSILEDGAWEKYAEPDDPASHGLKYPLLAFDPSTGKIGPAKVELASVREAAQKGDAAAIAALNAIRIPLND